MSKTKSSFLSTKLIALLSVALVVNSAPAISANIPAIAESFSEVNEIYIGFLTTIPSLFLVIGVFLTSIIEKRIGMKFTMMLGLLIVGIFGTLPAWYGTSFVFLFVSRCFLGLGIGLFNRLLIQLISHLFQNEDQKKAKALGLESAFEGLGGIFLTLMVGQLVKISWQTSFLVYSCAIASLLFVIFWIPNESSDQKIKEQKAIKKGSKKQKVKALFLGVILFCIVTLFINYNIQITPLLIEKGIGNATNGSTMIAAIGAGAFIAGNLFGVTYSYLKEWLLPVAALSAGLSILLTNFAPSLLMILICSLTLGFSFRNIMPYFMHTLTNGGEEAAKFGTTIVLVAYNLGATLSPYTAQVISTISHHTNASNQMLMTGSVLCFIGILTLIFKKFIAI